MSVTLEFWPPQPHHTLEGDDGEQLPAGTTIELADEDEADELLASDPDFRRAEAKHHKKTRSGAGETPDGGDDDTTQSPDRAERDQETT
jgi:hypothetical protein